jgi:hypothetical protein
LSAVGEAAQALELAEHIRPLLAGQPPGQVGAALAELLATWLAGHVVKDDEDATHALWAKLLGQHIAVVVRLTEVSARRMKAREGRQ